LFLSTQGTRDFYETTPTAVYDELMRQVNCNQPHYVARTIEREFNFKLDSKILDIGCGTGKLG
jgi:2-polyprenyl-3-methyl-5-hydroxy-6-metoxy-1,4-benzoquinol methylase